MAVFVILFFLYLRPQSTADTNERSIRLLVEALGQERFDWDRAATLPEGPRLVTVSPAFNEAENVAAVIKQIPAMIEGYHVIPVVVSDGFDGRTADGRTGGGGVRRGAADPSGRRPGAPRRLRGRAEASARRSWSRSTPTGSTSPRRSRVMIAPILAGEADYVNGSRLLGYFESESTIRHLGVHFFSRLVTILTGTRITDISSAAIARRGPTCSSSWCSSRISSGRARS